VGTRRENTLGAALVETFETTPPSRPPLQTTLIPDFGYGLNTRPDISSSLPFNESIGFESRPYFNLLKDPNNIFATNATLLTTGVETDGFDIPASLWASPTTDRARPGPTQPDPPAQPVPISARPSRLT
jgi:hypothetical protein